MSYRIVFSLLKPRSQNTQCASFWSWYRFEVSLSGLTAVFGRKPRTRSDITHFRPLSFTLSKHCAKRQNTVGSLTFPAFKSYLVHKRGQGVCTRMLPHTRAREHYFQTYQILALMRSVTPINTSTWGQELLLHYLYTRFPFKTHCSTFSDHPNAALARRLVVVEQLTVRRVVRGTATSFRAVSKTDSSLNFGAV